jgi:hypothetical protein
VAAGAGALSGLGYVPVPVAVRSVAAGAESGVVVEPGLVDLGEAQGRLERPGDLPGPGGVDEVAVAVPGGGAGDQEVPLLGLAVADDAGLHGAGPLVPLGGQLSGGDELDAGAGGSAGRARHGDHDRLSHLGPGSGLVFSFPGEGPQVFVFALADQIPAKLDGFGVQDAVAAAGALP